MSIVSSCIHCWCGLEVEMHWLTSQRSNGWFLHYRPGSVWSHVLPIPSRSFHCQRHRHDVTQPCAHSHVISHENDSNFNCIQCKRRLIMYLCHTRCGLNSQSERQHTQSNSQKSIDAYIEAVKNTIAMWTLILYNSILINKKLKWSDLDFRQKYWLFCSFRWWNSSDQSHRRTVVCEQQSYVFGTELTHVFERIEWLI